MSCIKNEFVWINCPRSFFHHPWYDKLSGVSIPTLSFSTCLKIWNLQEAWTPCCSFPQLQMVIPMVEKKKEKKKVWEEQSDSCMFELQYTICFDLSIKPPTQKKSLLITSNVSKYIRNNLKLSIWIRSKVVLTVVFVKKSLDFLKMCLNL